ncbi:MAG TPA: class I tRNA ligase family protein, partial [Acidisarcina sp.]
SYPHCWRCHNPVIYRATEQWFIGMETPMLNPGRDLGPAEISFRQRALDEIAKVKWDPKWGADRISNMIATRPDWCISRQRIWGVPIAVFLCEKCHTPLNDSAVNQSIVELFHRKGADAWYTHDAASLLNLAKPGRIACASCGASEFRKEMDIVDVWFESGASWHAVLEAEPGLAFPADLYTEGGDQHRGWFHSSLLTSVALRGTAPYRMVATSGWTLDETGRPLSKSLGNGVDPVDVAKRLGGEVVRLWVASVDFREDVAASENLMQRVADNYRKLRNTFRYLLGNLHGFDPADAVPYEKLLPLDQYMLARTRELTEKVLRWYEEFEFHRVYMAVNEFCVVDLSALYLDVLKDRMYTFAPTSAERLSAQTVMWRVTETLVRLLAPILSFTAEEIWSYLPPVHGREESVHLALFPSLGELAPGSFKQTIDEWGYLFDLRQNVLKTLEDARQEKRIGKGLEAKVEIGLPFASQEVAERYAASLKEFFNVSQVSLTYGEGSGVSSVPAEGDKCDRCWNFMPDVSAYGVWPNVCGRCRHALGEMGIAPPEGVLV